jgi:hypothetical protein
LSKRWLFTLVYIILVIVGVTLKDFGPRYGISEYVGWSILPLAVAITLYQQRPRQRRWLALGIFLVLEEAGFLLPWQNGLTIFISIFLIIAAFLAVAFIPPRMPLWPKKQTPEAQA